jgi:hypothetical protein
VFLVDVIWLPGKFDNVTLQTHAFRIVWYPHNSEYSNALEHIKTLRGNNSSESMAVVITNAEENRFLIKTVPTSKGQWVSLGSTGLRFNS